MIKGISIEDGFSGYTHLPYFFIDHPLSQIRDTIPVRNNSSVLQVSKPKIITGDTVSVDRQRFDQLFQVAEEREN
ncbi:MAG: hypothetical protein HC905_08715 [Bacteroidales bacterium]|nr:hypothetical protein [Bacteroidales bacterium]